MREIYNKQSLWSKIVNFSLIFFNDKANSSSEISAKKFIERNSLKKINYNMYKGFFKEIVDDHTIFLYNGNLSKSKEKIILYVHGGNFVQRANRFQINFAKKIAEETNSTLVIPMYDLLPSGDYKKMNDILHAVYNKISMLEQKDIIFMGDSAGGGAVLSFAMQLRESHKYSPSNIILISPWLDLSMTNPQLYNDEKKDKMNCVEGIKYEGKLWANGDDVCNSIISPMYGTFDNLGKISLIFGGQGILSSECKRFDELLSQSKIDHNYIFYENEGHDFAVFPTNESKKVIEKISNIINGKE